MKNLKRSAFTLSAGILLILGVSIVHAFAGLVITPYDAGKHIGEYVTVQGQISQVHISRKGNVFINMGGRYPHNAFTAVVFSRSQFSFQNAASWYGRQVRIKGYVKIYHGKPEIVLSSSSQIEEVR